MKAKKTLKKKTAAKRKKPLAKKIRVRKIQKKSKPKAKRSRKAPVIIAEEIIVEKAKFFSPQSFQHPQTPPKKYTPEELPSKYGVDKIALMARDPSWVYTWWEVKDSTISGLEAKYKNTFWQAKKILRVYDITDIHFNGHNAHRHFDIEVGTFIGSWFIEIGKGGRSWCVDLGLLFPDGKFVTILRSNVVTTPADRPSDILDEEWMIPDEMFARLYGMGFGFGKSSPVGRGWQERFRHVLSSGVSSGASRIKK